MDETEKTPLFSLTTEDGSIVIEKKSATACWGEVLQRAKAIREQKGEVAKKTAISGPEFFGYSLHSVRLMIEQLPNAEKCEEYVTLEKTLKDAVARQEKEKEAKAMAAEANATAEADGEEEKSAEKTAVANDENENALLISPNRITASTSPSRAFDSMKTTPLKQQSPSLSNSKKRPSPTHLSSSQKKTKNASPAAKTTAAATANEEDDDTQGEKRNETKKKTVSLSATPTTSAKKKKSNISPPKSVGKKLLSAAKKMFAGSSTPKEKNKNKA